MPWYCPAPPVTLADGRLEWTFRWEPNVPGLAVQELKIADGCALSFEDEAARIEHEICSVPGLLCNCCAGCECKVCDSCMYATAFHRCKNLPGRSLYHKSSLYGGKVDYQRVAGGSLAVYLYLQLSNHIGLVRTGRYSCSNSTIKA